MKKFVSILLILMFIMSMNLSAFATTIIVDDSTARSFNGYKLLNLTTELKADDACADGKHSGACYIYTYTVNDTYKDILQAMAGEEDILTYLSGLSSDSETALGSLHYAAEEIYADILAAGIAADASGLTNNSSIAEGYWLFVDVTNLGGQNGANSLIVVDTAGQDSLTISPKTALPTLVKQVKDGNDTTGEVSGWQSNADHDIDENPVPFKLTATLPENLANYDSYTLVFHDVMSSGLSMKTTPTVYMYANADDAAADTNGTNVTAYFTTVNDSPADNCSFERGCTNIKAINGVTKDSVFVLYYDGMLNSSADVGLPGNPNSAYLEFSNNPYGTGTGCTEQSSVVVYTYQLTINKTNANDEPLKGAGFTLYKMNANGTYTQLGEELKGEDMTTFQWIGLDDGDYKLEESTVPAGYNKLDDQIFTITATHEAGSQSLSAGDFAEGEFSTGLISKDVVNNTGVELPETGARGTMMLLTISSLVVMTAAVFMITRKKMSIYED